MLVATVAHRGDDARILHRQIDALVEEGFAVIYVAPEPEARGAEFDHVVVPRAVGRNRLGAWWAAAMAIRTYRDVADLILVHDLELVLPARMAARPGRVVWDVHEDLAQSVEDRDWIPLRLRRLACVLVAITEKVAAFRIRLLLAEESYAERFGPWPVVPNTTKVPPSLAPYRPDPLPRLVYVGRISRARGIEMMVEIGRRLHGECTVELVGATDADVRQTLETAVAEGFVTWRGYLSNDDALAVVNGALVGLSLLDALGNYVGSMPTKVYEYLARGVPVISTPLPLAVEVIEQSGAGAVVPYGDVDAVVQFVRRLLADVPQRVELGRRGYAWVADRHDWRVDGQRFAATIRRWAQHPSRSVAIRRRP